MTKKALRTATMFLDLDWIGACQPFTDDVRPTKSQSQQSHKFLKSLFLRDMCFFQTKAPTLQATEQCFDVAVATHKTIDLVFSARVFKLKREMQNCSRSSTPAASLRHNHLAEEKDETPAHSPSTCGRRSAPAGAPLASAQAHPRTPGARRCK